MPKTKTLAGPESTASDAQLLDLIVIVLAVEDLPLLRAFQDDLALVGDLQARRCVDSGLLGEQGGERFARFLADGVAILEEANLVDFGRSSALLIFSSVVDFVAPTRPRLSTDRDAPRWIDHSAKYFIFEWFMDLLGCSWK